MDVPSSRVAKKTEAIKVISTMLSLRMRENNAEVLKKTLDKTIENLKKSQNKSSSETKEKYDENKYQSGYIIKIFTELINKLKILFQMPAIVENDLELLNKYLRPAEVELILQLYQSVEEEESEEDTLSLEEEEEVEVDFHFGEYEFVGSRSTLGSSIVSEDRIIAMRTDGTAVTVDETGIEPPKTEVMNQKEPWNHDSPELQRIKKVLTKFGVFKQNQCDIESGSRSALIYRKNKHNASSKESFKQSLDFVMQSKGLIEVLKDGTYYKMEEYSAEARMIRAVEDLLGLLSEKLNNSMQDQMKLNNETRLAYRLGLFLDDNIFAILQFKAKNEVDYSTKQKEKTDIIIEYRQKMEDVKVNSTNQRNKTVADSEAAMMREINESELRQIEYAIEAQQSVQIYESLLHTNQKEEKLLKAKLMKVEAQVAAWLAKYDADIGELQAQLDKMQANCEELTKDVNAVKDRLDEQEYLYLPLMEEKAEEERILFEATLLNFVRNRSARIIQRTWRAYKARKLARKLARMRKAKARAMSGAPKALIKKKDKTKKEKKVREVREKKIKDPPPKTLEQKFGEDMFKDLADPDSSAFHAT